jgi:hypothetical protein
MFQFPGLSSVSYGFRYRWYRITGTGLPHSEICGYLVISTYPQLIAGSHVLHRLLVPRHPPYALSNLTENFYSQIVCALSVFLWLSKTFPILSENIFYSFNLSKNKFCGANRDRTDNLRLARAALSQLSYSPKNFF